MEYALEILTERLARLDESSFKLLLQTVNPNDPEYLKQVNQRIDLDDAILLIKTHLKAK